MPHGESTERVLWTECNVWPTDTNSRSHAPILYDKVNLSHLFSQFTALDLLIWIWGATEVNCLCSELKWRACWSVLLVRRFDLCWMLSWLLVYTWASWFTCFKMIHTLARFLVRLLHVSNICFNICTHL